MKQQESLLCFCACEVLYISLRCTWDRLVSPTSIYHSNSQLATRKQQAWLLRVADAIIAYRVPVPGMSRARIAKLNEAQPTPSLLQTLLHNMHNTCHIPEYDIF